MILKAERIAELLEAGRRKDESDPLVITPQPNLQYLRDSGSASVDIRLGTWFMNLRPARMSHLDIDDAQQAVQLTKTHYVRFGDRFILHPGSFVLGVTLEWVRLPGDLAAYVIGRSSWGRRGLIIATATGVHPGFKGCLTLELTNVGEIPIAIKPGMTICQLFLHRVEYSPQLKETVDHSRFVGLRKPALGLIKSDPFAKKLAEYDFETVQKCRKLNGRRYASAFARNNPGLLAKSDLHFVRTDMSIWRTSNTTT